MRKYVYYLRSIYTLLSEIDDPLRVIATFLRAADPSGSPRLQKFHLRRAGLDVIVRGKMDLWSVKEAVLDGFYEKAGVPVEDGWTVLDIGAGIGEFTLPAARKGKTVRVLAFEPFPPSFSLLQQNLQINPCSNVEAFHLGIWSQTGEIALDLREGEPLQLKSQGVSGSGNEHQVRVRCVSMVDLFQTFNLDRIDLLKLDCEGAEYPILYASPEDVLNRIDRIVMEYHDGEPPNCHPELVRFLEGNGYQVRSVPNVVHKEIGYLYASRVKDSQRGEEQAAGGGESGR